MPTPGPWITQDTLTGTGTLAPDNLAIDWTGGLENFGASVATVDSHHGARNIGDFGLTLAVAWDRVRGAGSVPDVQPRFNGLTDDWHSGLDLLNGGVFGWGAILESIAIRLDLWAYDDPTILTEFPDGAIDFEYEGDGAQHWDLLAEAVGTDDTVNRSGVVGDFDIYYESPGAFRVANADIETTSTYPQELLAATPAGHTVEFVDEPVIGMLFPDVKVNPLLDMLTGSAPGLDESVPDRMQVYQYSNTYVVNLDVTVRRPRYRWIFSFRKAPPCRIYPRDDDLGSGAGRIFPPSRSHQSSNRRGGGSYY